MHLLYFFGLLYALILEYNNDLKGYLPKNESYVNHYLPNP